MIGESTGACQKEFSAKYPPVGLRAIENLRIVQLVCELCDERFRLFFVLEHKRRIEVTGEQTRNA